MMLRPQNLGCILTFGLCLAQNPPHANYDESQVGNVVLPAVLKTSKGDQIRDARSWRAQRLPEILALFEEHVFGVVDRPLRAPSVAEIGRGTFAEGAGTWRELRLLMGDRQAFLLIALPTRHSKPVPVFLGLNTRGNQAVLNEPDININEHWMPNNLEGVVENHATAASRGRESSRWPLREIVASGFGVATAYYGDFFPDHLAGKRESIVPVDSSGGAIAAWAWGLRLLCGVVAQQPDIAGKHIIAIGHSRLGKAALWAAAQDTRIAGVVANNSGQGGAALARRNFGEAIADSVRIFPYWYTQRYREYSTQPEHLPVDQHLLLAAIAPRPVYVASASEDLWADPRGEWLSLVEAAPAYRLFGAPSITTEAWPKPGEVVHRGRTGYHLRAGKHDITTEDWLLFLRFFSRQR